MKMHTTLCLLIGALTACCVAAEKPNIVIIYADDLGYGDLSCYGATKLQTPNIDSLARDGRMFTDAHSTSAVCTPSRYALLTGQYPARIDNWGPVFCQHALIIDTNRTTIASLLQDQGYATACIGKWHLGFGTENYPDYNKALKPGPLEVGFDYFYGVPVVNSHPPFVYVENHHVVGLDPNDPLKHKPGGKTYSKVYEGKHAHPPKRMPSVVGGKKAYGLYVDEEVATDLTGKAVGWLKKQKGPFFLYLPTTNIHHPFTPHKRFQGTSQCGIYGDFVHELDWVVGEVLKTLDEMNVADNTLVIFTSDNGGMLNFGGKEAWEMGHHLNGKMLGHKFGAWEGGHRVPFLARWPKHIPAGSKSDALLSNLDMLATFAAITGRKIGDDEGPDSFNQLETLTGTPEKSARDHLMIQPHKSTHGSLRDGEWVYIPAQGSGGFGNGLQGLAITQRPNSDFKIVEEKNKKGEMQKVARLNKGAPKAQLYNLKKDPYQTTNVINQHPEVAERLKSRLQKLMQKKEVAPEKKKEAATPRSVSGKPNMILIYVDDMGYGDLGCYGSKFIRTPRIDKMASEGVRFTNCYSAANICTPSRAALLTGCYPQRCGLYMGISPKRARHKHLGLHPDEETIPELLKQIGYSTLCVGKWHLGFDPVFHPMNHGFDEYYGMPDNFLHSPKFWDGRKVVSKKANLAKITERYTERVIDFINRKKDEPFFIYLPHTYPHGPLVPNPKFKGKSKAGNYGDVIEELDWSTGKILDTLTELGLDENTIVIFSSDNGPVPQFAEQYDSSGKYKGSKYTSWEGGHRTPMIVRWPGKIPAGQVRDELTSTMDMLPTIVNIAGAPMPQEEIDGKDIRPLLKGDKNAESPHDMLYYYNCDHLQAVLWKEWKLHLPRTKEMCPWWQRNKGITDLEKPMLINITTDFKEETNVAEQHPEIVERMMKMAEKGRKQFGDFQKRGSLQRKTGNSRELK